MDNVLDVLRLLDEPAAIVLIGGGAIVGAIWGLIQSGDDFFLAAMATKFGVGGVLGGVAYIVLTTLS
ncbi:MAG TPA: hypothetical protein VHJ34_09635 [Actinomycetota bacterium]|nr:hypothetical protein [Actinomycetota bacterium]